MQALLDGGADINETNAGDKSSPLLIAAINGHFDLAKFLARKRSRSPTGQHCRRDSAVCHDQREVGARRRVSAARNETGEDHLSRPDESDAGSRRRSECEIRQELWYTGYSSSRTQIDVRWRDAVLARRSVQRRRRHAVC